MKDRLLGPNFTRRDAFKTMGIFLAGLVFIPELSRISKHLEPSFLTEVPLPITIDGVETYGHDTPLSQEQLNVLIASLNQKFNNGQVEMKNDTYYSIEAIHPSDYSDIPVIMGESYQSFITRHDQELSRIVNEASSLLNGMINRRLLVLGYGVGISASWHLGWYYEGIKDSDGIQFDESYNPTISAYYDSETKIDWGRIHEKAHRVLHLPDVYAINADFRFTSQACITNFPQKTLNLILNEADYLSQFIPRLKDPKFLQSLNQASQQTRESTPTLSTLPAFKNVPVSWQQYFTGQRNDNRKGLLSSEDHYFCSYTTEMMNRRVRENWTHDLLKTIPETAWAYPNEFAAINKLVIGEQFNGANVTVYRSSGDQFNKTIQDIVFQGTVADGQLNIGNPFLGIQLTADGLIPSQNALLFVRMETTQPIDGHSLWFRYLDTGDFSIPFWKQNRSQLLQLKMNLAHENISPLDFDWRTIIVDNKKVYLPLIGR